MWLPRGSGASDAPQFVRFRVEDTMRAVVTGCAGFIGSTLTDRLLARGWEVTGIDSFEGYYDRRLKEANLQGARRESGFRLVEADIVDLAAEGASGSPLRDLIGAADHVYHLAAQPGVRASWGGMFDTYVRNNVLATQVLLECAKQAGVEAFVCASSSSVYGDTPVLPMEEAAECRPFSPYGVTKLASEHLARLYARNFGVPTVSLRFFTVYGPRQRPDMAFHKFIAAATEGRPVEVYGDGGQTRDFTFVDDIIDGILAAPAAPAGAVLNLGGGSRVTLAYALGTLAEVVGHELVIERGGAQAGDVRDTWASIARARDAIGYAPKVDLAAGLAAEYAWFIEGSGA
jgi:UDP-glucose 4-epimerase